VQNSLRAIKREAKEIGGPRLSYLWSLTFGHMVVHWYTGLLPLLIPSLKTALRLSSIQVGGITAAQMGVSGATTLPSGYLADTYKRQTPLILASAIVVLGIAYLILGTIHSYPWALVASGLIGLGMALWHPGATGSLSLRFPDRRGFALAGHGVGASFGDAIVPVTVGAIILAVSWQLVLKLHILPALILAVILWRAMQSTGLTQGSKPSFRSYVGDIRSMLSNRQVLAVMASSTLVGMARLSILTFLPIYIEENLAYSSFGLGVYLSLLHLMGIVSQPIMGILSDKIGRKAILVPGFTIMGLLYLAIVFVGGGIPLGLVIGLLGLFFYAILNVTHTAVMDVAAEGVQASTFAIVVLFSQPFSLASPILAGWLVSEYGIKMTFWYSAIVTLLAAALLIPVRFKRPETQRNVP
jgi:FSR family fosmidomycin resistance protein-like MFS transporter